MTHAALIAAAVAWTGSPPRQAGDHETVLGTHVTYVTPAMLLAALQSSHRGAVGPATKKARSFVLPNLDAVERSVDGLTQVSTTDPDLPVVTSAWSAQDDTLPIGHGSVRDALGLGPIAPMPVDGAYTEAMVDRPIMPRHGNPVPRYPGALQSAGIEGSFMVQFVVDSTGKVEPDKIEFPSAMHRLFVESVRNALLRSRYFPAQIAGRFVAQRAIQEFRFTIAR